MDEQNVDRRAFLPGFALKVDDVARPAFVDVLRDHLADEARRGREELSAALLAGQLLDDGVGHVQAALGQGRFKARRAGVTQLFVQRRYSLAEGIDGLVFGLSEHVCL